MELRRSLLCDVAPGGVWGLATEKTPFVGSGSSYTLTPLVTLK